MNRLQRSSFKRFLFLSFSRESSPNPDPRTDIWDGLEAHHRVPLEHAHLFPNANPNRIANLVGVESGVHTQITNSWNAWGRALNGRTPTDAEVIKQAISVDEQFGQSFRFVR
jgi:hypothetical protein